MRKFSINNIKSQIVIQGNNGFKKMKLLFIIVGLTLTGCSNPKDDIYTTFGLALDNKENVYQFMYDPDFSGVVYNRIPDFVCTFPNLRSFTMDQANLTEMPSCMASMNTISFLDLSFNKLSKLPSNIGNMKKLHYVSFIGNELESVPESIGDLPNIQYLYLRGNKLKSLPDSFSKLTKLKRLDLAHNNFSNIEKRRINQMLPNCEIFW